jgi:hypothetical protein
MFDIHALEEGGFEITADPPYGYSVLRGFYSSFYKKYVITETLAPWWFTAEELREIASLLDYYDYPA